MSWILPTIFLLVAGFACIFGFCEWFVGRPRVRHSDDDPSPAG